MSKKKRKKYNPARSTETQQKDDRVTAKELVTLSTALVQLLVALITLAILLIKE